MLKYQLYYFILFKGHYLLKVMYFLVKYNKFTILFFFFFSLLFSIFTWMMAKDYYDAQNKEKFHEYTHESIKKIENRLLRCGDILSAGASYINSSDYVSQQDWHSFVEGLNIEENYPSMQGYGFSIMLKPNEVVPLEQKMRAQGNTSFTLKPEGVREQYSSILYLEPLDKRNAAAIGYDMYSNQTRKIAMDIARDTGKTTLSGKVILVQEIDKNKQSGMLLYTPVYKKNIDLDNLQERRKGLIGFVYSPFRMNDFIDRAEIGTDELDFNIYDSIDHTDKTLLYHSNKNITHKSKYSAEATVTLYNHTWYITFYSTHHFDMSNEDHYILSIAALALLVFFGLLSIIYTLFKSRYLLQIQRNELEEYKNLLEDKVESEIDKRRAQEVLMIQQSRLASMGEMIGNIAHQWRQPLNTLALVIQNLKDSYYFGELDDLQLNKFVDNSNELIQKMSSTIDDFRYFFNPNNEKKSFNVDAIICESLNLIEAMLRSNNISLEKEMGSNIFIHGYSNEFSQVILNIINNAKDALIQNKTDDRKIKIELSSEDGKIVVAISDNAGGIPEAIIDQIFNPYFSTKEQMNGTGIGLYMSKVIIEDHMLGKLRVENIKNSDSQVTGALFVIDIDKDL